MGGEMLDAEDEVVSSMWPEDIGNGARMQFNIEKPGMAGDMLKEVTSKRVPSVMEIDFKRLIELNEYSEKGSSQLAYFAKHWEYKHVNAIRLLNEEFHILSKQRQEVELRKLEILKENLFEEERHTGSRRPLCVLDELSDIRGRVPKRRNDLPAYNKNVDIEAEYGTVKYWKECALQLEKMLEASMQRERTLSQKLQDTIKNLESKSASVEELSQTLKRADSFLHFILQTAPVVIGHQDKDLRYRFIYNHFPSLEEEDIIGKTDVEILTGDGVKETQDFKQEVLERGLPAKREMTFNTPLFGAKTFMIYVEPVFSKKGENIGINFLAMDITDQVRKREKIARLREEMAVQKAKESELNRTIHITEETMRAKEMLATMSHEIRSPLTGVVSMAEILATTKLDNEQRQLLDVMLSSGDLVLQLINDILDLSKVESGVMKLEAAKFRPREVVRHVLQTAAASLKKELILEAHVADEVPVEVIGDVLRIRQILTNLLSNGIKFTHKGKVGISFQLKYPGYHEQPEVGSDSSFSPLTKLSVDSIQQRPNCNDSLANDKCITNQKASSTVDATQNNHFQCESLVWLQCSVYDTGIGIPEKALPSLFTQYMQASTDHARKYGGTGLGLAICKQLVELMGGNLTVTSQENYGSTFTFVLPFKVPLKQDSADAYEMGVYDGESLSDSSTDGIVGSFLFKPRKSGESVVSKTNLPGICNYGALNTSIQLSEETMLFSSDDKARKSTFTPDASPNSDVISLLAEAEGPADQKCGCKVNDLVSANSREKKYTYLKQGLSLNKFDNININPRGQKIAHSENGRMMSTGGANLDASGKCESTGDNQTLEQGNTSTQWVSNNTSSPRILLVEDNMINVIVAQKMMKQLGYTIEVVNNGLEAIHALQRFHYDLIFMLMQLGNNLLHYAGEAGDEKDICMPVMDGLQATRLIRSFEELGVWDASVAIGIQHATPSPDLLSHPSAAERRRVPIIAMTANAMAESAGDCLASGMDSFVSKPVTFQSLKQCLQQYLPCYC